MITDVVLTVDIVTITVVLFIWCLSFISVVVLLLSDADYKTKNSYSIMVLGLIVFVCFYILVMCCYRYSRYSLNFPENEKSLGA